MFNYILLKNTTNTGVGSIFTNVKKLVMIAGSMAGVSLLLSVVVTVVLLAKDNDERHVYDAPVFFVENIVEYAAIELDVTAINRPEEDDHGGVLRPPARTNFLLAGLDQQRLTDGLMVGTFYRDSGAIHLMSIPRDMYTVIPVHRLKKIHSEGVSMPSPIKINEVRAFAGRENGINYLKEQLGEMLGVHFHYHIEVELAAFRRIVDAVGGVEMYIPRPFIYNDPTQNLDINIPAGLQKLDGAMAEGVVRFRSFPTADLARNNMQMEFMTQLIRQALVKDAIMNDPLTLINVILSDVRSNIGLDAIKYIPFISGFNGDNVSTFIMPGGEMRIRGVSWFKPDAEQLPDVINQVFYADVQR